MNQLVLSVNQLKPVIHCNFTNLNPLPFKQSEEISKYLDVISVIKLSQVSKLFRGEVKIINFTEIDADNFKMTDEILKLPIFNHLQSLYAYNNQNITDRGIIKLKLINLNANDNLKITDYGIENIKHN